MRAGLLITFLTLILAACAPAAQSAVCGIPDTSFVATINLVSLDNAQLKVRANNGGPKLITVTVDGDARILSKQGEALELSALNPGMRVWISGIMPGRSGVIADELRLLDESS